MESEAHRGPNGGPTAPPRAPRFGGVNADVRAWRYADVACQQCAAVVGVVKFSAAHTSVQWTSEAVLACAEFCARVSAGELSALIPTCSSLGASIDAAVADGRVQVLPP